MRCSRRTGRSHVETRKSPSTFEPAMPASGSKQAEALGESLCSH